MTLFVPGQIRAALAAVTRDHVRRSIGNLRLPLLPAELLRLPARG